MPRSRSLLPEHVWAGPQHPPPSVPNPLRPFLPEDFALWLQGTPKAGSILPDMQKSSHGLIHQPEPLTACHQQSPGLVP